MTPKLRGRALGALLQGKRASGGRLLLAEGDQAEALGKRVAAALFEPGAGALLNA
ncbi:hypothetical protein [Dyella sp. EPa41]|uniref:hypothetical protein n=1 Tax=Dyella sp. EPa41 TaxID=1561194 RepID=UPI001915D144|nr:hypothetical protein [Dyella sp. EPa41]